MPRSGRRKRIKAYCCPYCPSSFDNEEGINRHIGHSPTCYAKREQDANTVATSLHQDPDDPEGYESDNSETYRQLHFLNGDELEAYLDTHEPLPPVLTAKALQGDESESEDEEKDQLVGEDGEEVSDGAIDVSEALPSISRPPRPYVETFEGAATALRSEKTRFEVRAEGDKAKVGKQNPWGSLQDQKHFEMAEWLLKSGVSRAKMDSFLKLGIVS